ncbi:MAG TPA: ABC transporter substrate-binding protein [Clostridiales bacterium]|jgi:iron complex transport system substrate-binding protein|nr:ABC transporter substrate-binding protein [Clostridiales bacterium]
MAFTVPGCVTKGGTGDQTKTITVTDMEGRSVTVKAPVERIVLMESSKTHELAAIDGAGIVDKIVGWDNDFKDNAGDGYVKFVEKYPELANIPNVGSLDDNTFSVEKVIALNPDVVIMHNWEFMWSGDATKEALARLEQAGIPVVFVDFYMDPMVNSTKSMLLLGQILGKEQRSKEIVDFYDQHVNTVYSRLAKNVGPKPGVYIETGYNGPETYGITEGDVGWGSIVKKAGGNNIAETLLGNTSKAISPEFLVNQSPDIIILTGRNWSTPGSIRMGYTSTAADTKSTVDAYVARPGWNTINAVKNRNVYGIYHGYCFSIYNFVALEAFAKWFYPEEFKDIDPNATIREYHEKFMPIEYDGTFMYSYY